MLILTALAIAAAPLAAQGDPPGKAQSSLADWPQWRGPTHDGHAANEKLIEAFPAGGPPILWVRDLGQGYSGFAIAGQRAYTLTQTLYEQSVVCLDRDTGKTVWSYRCGWPYDGGGLYPGPRSTPSLADGKVYFATPQGLVGCLKAENGEPVWSLNINEKFGGRGTEFGYSASPLVTEGLVILPVGGENASVVALRCEDGSLAWKSGSRPASYATPLPIEWRGHALVVVLLQNSLACFDRTSGELWWESSLSHGYDEHAAAPLYREPYLLIAGPFHSGAQMLRLDEQLETGRCQPTPVWLCEEMSNDVASSVLSADTVFGFDLKDMQSRLHRPSRGEFRAVDWLTGKVRWSSQRAGARADRCRRWQAGAVQRPRRDDPGPRVRRSLRGTRPAGDLSRRNLLDSGGTLGRQTNCANADARRLHLSGARSARRACVHNYGRQPRQPPSVRTRFATGR